MLEKAVVITVKWKYTCPSANEGIKCYVLRSSYPVVLNRVRVNAIGVYYGDGEYYIYNDLFSRGVE